MAPKRVPPNNPCPCGSGKRHRSCCYKKKFAWEQDDRGRHTRSVPLHPEAVQIIEDQRQRFIDLHGREPGPNDPIFFDMPHPEHLEHQIAETMRKAGIAPELIYAFEQTGRLVTTENRELLTDEDLAEWDAAIDAYRAKQGDR
jgi:hypothetical protein